MLIVNVRDIIEKKNEVYSKKENLKEKISEFDERRAEVEEGISRIPDDLPEELQQQVDAAVENARAELRSEAEEIGEEADDASAENLSDYNIKKKTYLDCDDFAIVRHRRYFDGTAGKSDYFYPNVHIQPINDGGLLIASFYIYCKLHGSVNDVPREFLERISFANYCKYTIRPISHTRKQNIDYPSNSKYLAESHEYIINDIKILKPDYIILPKTIYQTDYNFLNEIKGNAKIIPIYQINARNINIRISKYPKLETKDLDNTLREWYEHLGSNGISGKTKQNFLSIFSYLDHILEHEIR